MKTLVFFKKNGLVLSAREGEGRGKKTSTRSTATCILRRNYAFFLNFFLRKKYALLHFRENLKFSPPKKKKSLFSILLLLKILY